MRARALLRVFPSIFDCVPFGYCSSATQRSKCAHIYIDYFLLSAGPDDVRRTAVATQSPPKIKSRTHSPDGTCDHKASRTCLPHSVGFGGGDPDREKKNHNRWRECVHTEPLAPRTNALTEMTTGGFRNPPAVSTASAISRNTRVYKIYSPNQPPHRCVQ